MNQITTPGIPITLSYRRNGNIAEGPVIGIEWEPFEDGWVPGRWHVVDSVNPRTTWTIEPDEVERIDPGFGIG